MALMDPISNAMISIKNCERAAKRECIFRPASKLLGNILNVMKKNDYIEGFELIDDKREGIFRIKLNGRINECRAIRPRYTVKKDEFEKFEKRFLPSKDVGILIVTTPEGVFSHKEAKEKGIGGRLLAFVY